MQNPCASQNNQTLPVYIVNNKSNGEQMDLCFVLSRYVIILENCISHSFRSSVWIVITLLYTLGHIPRFPRCISNHYCFSAVHDTLSIHSVALMPIHCSSEWYRK